MSVKDSDLRARLLKMFYEHRHDDRPVSFGAGEYPAGEHESYNRIIRQLSENGLVEIMSNPLEGRVSCRISAFGVDTIEGNVASPIALTFNDSSIRIHESNNVQIGSGNTIRTSSDVSRIEHAIDRLPITDHEKAETKTLLSGISSNASFASLVGAIATMLGGSAH